MYMFDNSNEAYQKYEAARKAEIEELAKNEEECIWCRGKADEHLTYFECKICCTFCLESDKRETNCENSCSCCLACLRSSIKSQFGRNLDLVKFKCICVNGDLGEEAVQSALDNESREQLARIRLARKVDADDNLLWCTNLACRGGLIELNKLGNHSQTSKATCEQCGESICIKCQMPWHDNNPCKDSNQR